MTRCAASRRAKDRSCPHHPKLLFSYLSSLSDLVAPLELVVLDALHFAIPRHELFQAVIPAGKHKQNTKTSRSNKNTLKLRTKKRRSSRSSPDSQAAAETARVCVCVCVCIY